jgi:hypothetical protein
MLVESMVRKTLGLKDHRVVRVTGGPEEGLVANLAARKRFGGFSMSGDRSKRRR